MSKSFENSVMDGRRDRGTYRAELIGSFGRVLGPKIWDISDVSRVFWVERYTNRTKAPSVGVQRKNL